MSCAKDSPGNRPLASLCRSGGAGQGGFDLWSDAAPYLQDIVRDMRELTRRVVN